ncbi:zinc finger protein DZIP1 isoform X2 [Protopterus annectens]|uniref:zinc finger protein DZIP1 isoform X2 n=1 Tax=Protopterus annectens TaxID=7888 RepID=UPI001CFBAE7A|nr:zinc finger protein DZIP1 isoform X2 [Protopterus annectens]
MWTYGMTSLPAAPPYHPPPDTAAPLNSLRIPPFKFLPRTECVDWRRISSIDVNKVAVELDFVTLQDVIPSVAFCSVENEKCPYCKNPVDSVLLKLFTLSQLTIEYLLHSQEYLTATLQALQEKLQASELDKDQIRNEMKKSSEEIISLKEECKHRKKMIRNLQTLLNQAGASNYHKCQFCDKAFMNYSFLQNHIERRHVEDTIVEKRKASQAYTFQEEITKLEEQLHATRCQLQAERESYASRLAQEQELMKQFEKWKAEDKENLCGEMGKMKEMFTKELKALSSQNAKLENELLLVKSDIFRKSNLGTLRDVEIPEKEEERRTLRHDNQSLRDLLQNQEKEWTSRIESVIKHHENEKSEMQTELSTMKSLVKKEQQKDNALYVKQINQLYHRIQEQDEQIKRLSSRSPEKIKEHTVFVPRMVSTVSELIAYEPERSAAPLEPVQELSQEDQGPQRSACVMEPVEKLSEVDKEPFKTVKRENISKQLLKQALKKNPSLTKDLRPVLEQTLVEKLESIGIRPDIRGISKNHLNDVLTTIRSQRKEKAKKTPEIQQIWSQLSHKIETKVREQSTPTAVIPVCSASKLKGIQNKTRSEGSGQQKVAPRSEVTDQPKSSVPPTKPNCIPSHKATETQPFSSEDESDEPKKEFIQPNVIRSKALVAKNSSVVATHTFSDCTEESDVEVLDLKLLETSQANKVPLLKTLSDKPEERHPIQVFQKSFTINSEKQAPSKKDTVKEQKCFETDDDSDWDMSYIEDNKLLEAETKKGACGLLGSVEPNTLMTSKAWGSPGKLIRAGKTDGFHEGDTTSTLKSSLVSVTDWSDSDDIETL